VFSFFLQTSRRKAPANAAFGTLRDFLAALEPINRGVIIYILQSMTPLAPTDREEVVGNAEYMLGGPGIRKTVSKVDRDLVVEAIRNLASLRGDQLAAGLDRVLPLEVVPEEVPEAIETEERSAATSSLDSLEVSAATLSPERGRPPRTVSPERRVPSLTVADYVSSDSSSRSRLHGERLVDEEKEEITGPKCEEDHEEDLATQEGNSDANMLIGSGSNDDAKEKTQQERKSKGDESLPDKSELDCSTSDLNHDEGTDTKAEYESASLVKLKLVWKAARKRKLMTWTRATTQAQQEAAASTNSVAEEATKQAHIAVALADTGSVAVDTGDANELEPDASHDSAEDTGSVADDTGDVENIDDDDAEDGDVDNTPTGVAFNDDDTEDGDFDDTPGGVAPRGNGADHTPTGVAPGVAPATETDKKYQELIPDCDDDDSSDEDFVPADDNDSESNGGADDTGNAGIVNTDHADDTGSVAKDSADDTGSVADESGNAASSDQEGVLESQEGTPEVVGGGGEARRNHSPEAGVDAQVVSDSGVATESCCVIL
jgi:hypothetical protein